jgi:hypothetical protein
MTKFEALVIETVIIKNASLFATSAKKMLKASDTLDQIGADYVMIDKSDIYGTYTIEIKQA